LGIDYWETGGDALHLLTMSLTHLRSKSP